MNRYERCERLDKIKNVARHIGVAGLILFLVVSILALVWVTLLLSAVTPINVVVGILATISVLAGAVWFAITYVQDTWF